VTQRRESNISVWWVPYTNGSVENTAGQEEGIHGKKKRALTMVARGGASDDAHMNETLNNEKGWQLDRASRTFGIRDSNNIFMKEGKKEGRMRDESRWRPTR
jgi:hypothetical protein